MRGHTFLALPTCKGAGQATLIVEVTQVPARLLGGKMVFLNYGGLVKGTLRTGHLGRI